ncbi:ParB/RepB/Spo0J family partition protein [Ancylobacter pratisalsi]|uniref:ParB N-terminal domain-containing protein n=1 Tax=Ancylobacter pratisalsi TaxID=1745854 RepID=A0A6P1YNS0_9HYPH|nr:ParB N-terminal domain-containing protein [Ancylobacter pratisalsi]QIB34785.1 ParB N-terminal domain-containing protein [Ancylobacter pratisalsi]
MTEIPVAAVTVPNDRLKQRSSERIEELKLSIGELGLLSPILVQSPGRGDRYRLIGGLHRFEAVRDLGWEVVPAVVLDIKGMKARLAEIDENLVRSGLSPLEWAEHFAERKVVYEALHPETKHGGDRRSTKFDNLATWSERFTASAAKQFGMSERSIVRAVERYKKIDPNVRVRIVGSALASRGTHLDALARLAPEIQSRVVDMILSGEDDAPRSVSQAAARLSGARAAGASDADVQLDALMKAWRRAGASARARFTEFLES